ncbi:uncharacterized protein LOC113146693 [Cyclospora cayetanensis]|uniref:Uncharacterized protein LOC113146693 n=1 Tax=Cyclospora cayetanensis TaxID=88456 RepID=A0A6P6RU21_9EIME|nr:uncharacterized protein LOC113146693 [Cyclospora cayetanensis]
MKQPPRRGPVDSDTKDYSLIAAALKSHPTPRKNEERQAEAETQSAASLGTLRGENRKRMSIAGVALAASSAAPQNNHETIAAAAAAAAVAATIYLEGVVANRKKTATEIRRNPKESEWPSPCLSRHAAAAFVAAAAAALGVPHKGMAALRAATAAALCNRYSPRLPSGDFQPLLAVRVL